MPVSDLVGAGLLGKTIDETSGGVGSLSCTLPGALLHASLSLHRVLVP